MEINPGPWATHFAYWIIHKLSWLKQVTLKLSRAHLVPPWLGPDPALIPQFVLHHVCAFYDWFKTEQLLHQGLCTLFYSKADVVYIWSFLDIQEHIDQSLPSGRTVLSYFFCISAVQGHVSGGPCRAGDGVFTILELICFRPDRWV